MRYIRFFLIILLLSIVVVACQKDQDVDLTLKSKVKADSTATAGNLLAVKGTLSILIGDSTYIFDAAKDSIAFINVNVDSSKYFGITAINKQHTMSFGISSSGLAAADLTKPIAGGQLLFSADDKHTMQYALTKNFDKQAANSMSLVQYMQDSVLSKGTFLTVMSKDGSPNSSYKVQGSFNLLLK